MKIKPRHTPTPWRTDADTEHMTLIDKKGRLIADCAIYGRGFTSAQNVANAALVKRAVNSHHAMIDALESAKRLMDSLEMAGQLAMSPNIPSKIEAALRLARGDFH